MKEDGVPPIVVVAVKTDGGHNLKQPTHYNALRHLEARGVPLSLFTPTY